MTMDSRLLWGALDLLILEVVAREPTYGYEIVQNILSKSEGRFELKEGSLYPALHRLERQKLLSSHWVDTDRNRRRKYYKITAAGSKKLAAKRKEWESFSNMVDGVLELNREMARGS